MGRRAPRRISAALGRIQGDLEPPSLLAAVQAAWPGVAGSAIASVAEPVSERDGVVTVLCDDSVWAEELTLMSAEMITKLSDHLDVPAAFELRFRSR